MPLTVSEFDTYISPDGHEYRLTAPEVRWVINIQGTGMPPIDYLTERGPYQHGDTLLDFRLRPRVIQMVVRHNYASAAQTSHGRLQLLDVLRPNRQIIGQIAPGQLRHTFRDGSKLDLDVMIEQGPNFEPSKQDQWDEWSFQEVIRFIAHNPVFYNPSEHSNQFINNAAQIAALTQLTFPITFPITFNRDFGQPGMFVPDPYTINYPGTWFDYPKIIITGPIDDPLSITNITTDETILLDYELQPAEIVTINLAYGQKTVTNNSGTNLIGRISSDSDLGTFHIVPGVNQFSLGFHGNDANSRIELRYKDRYIGY